MALWIALSICEKNVLHNWSNFNCITTAQNHKSQCSGAIPREEDSSEQQISAVLPERAAMRHNILLRSQDVMMTVTQIRRVSPPCCRAVNQSGKLDSIFYFKNLITGLCVWAGSALCSALQQVLSPSCGTFSLLNIEVGLWWGWWGQR